MYKVDKDTACVFCTLIKCLGTIFYVLAIENCPTPRWTSPGNIGTESFRRAEKTDSPESKQVFIYGIMII